MNILKKRGVAWIVTLVVIVAAIGIGQAKKPGQSTGSYVYDEANVLSNATENTLEQRNAELLERWNVAVAVVTCNYGKFDLGGYAIDFAEDIGLGENDFIVVLDISGDNYWLVQGSGLVNAFTDDDCTAYAWSYMETAFAQGDYDSAVLSLTEALAAWYHDYY